MISQPIDDILRDARCVLLCGIGGGYDFLCGLPLQLELEARGVEIFVANLTFTALAQVRGGTWHDPHLLEVNAEASGPEYFPEKWLCAWFSARHARAMTVYCLEATGLRPLQASYRTLFERIRPDTVIAVDGGVDSLMRGDEYSLGTPLWDALSMGTLVGLPVARRVLVTTAFGAERWDKIAHADALSRMAELTAEGAFWGSESLVATSACGRSFLDAVDWMFAQQPNARGSIVVSSLVDSLRGRFGERPVNNRTHNTPLWISPLMALYWYFDLDAVVRHKRFLPALQDTDTLEEAGAALGKWVDAQPRGSWNDIPI